MGTTYCFVKLDKPEFFDMDKGFGDWVQPNPFMVPARWTTPTDLAQDIQRIIKEGNWETGDYTVWTHTVAGAIFDWSKWDRVLFMSDATLKDDDFKHVLKQFGSLLRWEPLNYAETGSRFHVPYFN